MTPSHLSTPAASAGGTNDVEGPIPAKVTPPPRRQAASPPRGEPLPTDKSVSCTSGRGLRYHAGVALKYEGRRYEVQGAGCTERFLTNGTEGTR